MLQSVSPSSLSHSSLILSISLIRVLAQTIFYFNAVCLLKKLLSGIFYIFFNVNQFFSFDFFLSDQFYFVAVSDQTWFGSFPLTILDIFGVFKLHLLRIIFLLIWIFNFYYVR